MHLFERECSIQRRHQKVIEESPSPFLTPELRERMGSAGGGPRRGASATCNAGTLEFLVDEERNPYFLEMNTRLQVEHPVTEMVTGEDLVKLQIRIAQGEPLPFAPGGPAPARPRHRVPRLRRGPRARASCPAPAGSWPCGRPAAPACATTRGVYEGYEVPIHYDPLISKLVAYGYSRRDAILRMRRAVAEYKVLGIKTTLPFFERVLRHPAFVAGDFDTSFVEVVFAESRPRARRGRWRWRWRRRPSGAFRERHRPRGGVERPRHRPAAPGCAACAGGRRSGTALAGRRAMIFDATVDGRTMRVEVRGQGRTLRRRSSTATPLEVDLQETGATS